MPIPLAEAQRLTPSAIMEFFELDTSMFVGGAIDYFHAGTNQLNSPVIWQGQTYEPWPVKATGFDRSGRGTLPQPRLACSNFQGMFSAYVKDFQDLIGAKVTRRRTHVRYIDRENFVGWEGYAALAADGVSARMEKNAPTGPFSSQYVTIESDVYIPNTATTSTYYFLRYDFIGNGYALLGTSTNFSFMIGNAGAAEAVNVARAGYMDKWIKLTGVYDGSNGILYINGQQVAIAPTFTDGVVLDTVPGSLRLIEQTNADPLFFKQRNTRIYGRALSPAEIAEHAEGIYTDETGLIGHWPLQADFQDTSGNNNHLSPIIAGATIIPSVDTNPSYDPTMEYTPEIWFINRKALQNNKVLEFELASAFDVAGVKLPRRQIQRNICAWVAIGGYRGPYCGYAGGPVANLNDEPVGTLAEDDCGGRLVSCRMRFGDNAELPIGSFPGAGLNR